MNPNQADVKSTSQTPTDSMGKAVSDMVRNAQDIRKPFERRWYDNYFFDDGFHYRFVSKNTGKMVDLSENGNIYNPFRAIPKSSKQIRSVINALLQNSYIPVVYPKRVIVEDYDTPQEYQDALKLAKIEAKKQGKWLEHMWDKLEMTQIIAQLFIIASKSAVAYLKIWPDKTNERICIEVVDAFDMYILGQKHNKKDLPFMIEEHPTQITEIWANQNFDEEQKIKIIPDNKYSDSQIKEAYMRVKFGLNVPSEFNRTALLREAYVLEYLDDNNLPKIQAQAGGDKILRGRKKGDQIIRQVYVANQTWLSDKYIAFDDFPYIPLQLEPGPFYQTPLMERFIQINKTLDTIVSRVERYTNTMVAGAWQKRKGENVQPTNLAGGVVYEYETTPLQQLEIAPVPNYVFNFINLLNSFIAEQGMMASAVNLPTGVKAAQAIEALKAQEIAQLKITDDQLKLFIKRWAEMMLKLANDYFVTKQEVVALDKGEPMYFDIVGGAAYKKMQDLKMDTSGITPIHDDLVVEVKAEVGLGYTPEARKAAALQLAQFLQAMTTAGVIPPQAMQQFVQNLLDAYGFGNTQDFMELVNAAPQQTVSPQILDQIKIAVASVFKDVLSGQENPNQPASPQSPPGGSSGSGMNSANVAAQGMPMGAVATAPRMNPPANPNTASSPVSVMQQGSGGGQ